ncbi:hypothetical protein GLOTRDRAFT_120953 [Gloeophyllum trabeum ATCC 11539]|uniref:Uncharacterized protein n=1 Tax=Gloeophyllum trabeum (strain ATCC 11539 / FP-39264 / Madison 617) TaxID=670483 RepID=S7RPM2_GLOTA|nr:uncharacterized protein GLOTRDRAFT_120953 [Gloeophyllum trabeum ATCC 11539]EPQ56485.1 hypothetical protein GLOTRDRAFT_120953 [Gloeophyllum trabeum ATCC 11539]
MLLVLLGLASAFWYLLFRINLNLLGGGDLTENGIPACPQVDAIHPVKHSILHSQLEVLYGWEGFKLSVYSRLGRAIQIPTESYDDLKPVGQDQRWDIFGTLHEYLETAFPLVCCPRRSFNGKSVGAPAIFWPIRRFELFGFARECSRIPDIGKWIWGRGSVDDKADLITQLVTVDALLKHGFSPSRTIVLAYGIDEEASGQEGAGKLAGYLEQAYGKDGFAILIDEGGGFKNLGGGDVIMAAPDISEKGYLDIGIQVNTKGGHSSIPPAHTSIGMLSSMIVHLESHAHSPQLRRSGTPFSLAQCLAAYDPSFPPELRRLAAEALSDDRALEQFKEGLVSLFPVWEATLKTTQAVDLVSGGVKVNALPESAEAVVNHRIAEHSSVRELQEHITTLLSPIAETHNLTVKAFGEEVSAGETAAGELVLSDAFYNALEVSPVTPFFGSAPARLLSGTIKATIESSTRYNANHVVVAPSFANGNTGN